MKVATRVVAILAVLASATAANAATHLWFTASNPTGTAGITNAGGPGVGTDLTCDDTLANAVCQWTITMAFQNDAGDEAMSGWATDLATREQITGKISITSFLYASNNFTTHAPANPVLGAGPQLLFNANGTDFGAGSSGTVLGTFTLRKVKTAAGSTNVDHIYATSGGNEWAGVFGDYPDMQAGGSAVVPQGGAGGTDLGDVITITNRPEPATMSMLGLGALALIRRRR